MFKTLLKILLLIIIFINFTSLAVKADTFPLPDNMPNEISQYVYSAQGSKSIKAKITYYQRAIELAKQKETKDYDLIARLAFNKAFIAGKSGYYQTSIDAYTLCIDALRKSDQFTNSELGFLSLYNVAQNYKRINDFASVEASYYLILFTQKSYLPEYAYRRFKAIYELGCIVADKGEYDEAIYYLSQAVDSLKDENQWMDSTSRPLFCDAIVKMGRIKLLQKKTDEAFNFFQKAISYNYAISSELDKGDIYSYLGFIYQYRHNYQSAKENYEKALVLYKNAEFNHKLFPKSGQGIKTIKHIQKYKTMKNLLAIYKRLNVNEVRINKLKQELKNKDRIQLKVVNIAH